MEVEGAPLLQGVAVTSAQGARRSSLAVASRWWSVARLWWRSSDRRRAWTYVATCAAFSLANVGLLLWISYAQNALQSSLSEKQAGASAQGQRRTSSWAGGGVGLIGAPVLARLPTRAGDGPLLGSPGAATVSLLPCLRSHPCPTCPTLRSCSRRCCNPPGRGV